ncbi:major facilitator superfamily transporter [Apiospora rasikravindrae]|uniref:Major facilitator superfamily transporter n=1 Tax=Apiospora rasikravindrae TaxID=990691 RepID=A0ABR1T523_9PEZI
MTAYHQAAGARTTASTDGDVPDTDDKPSSTQRHVYSNAAAYRVTNILCAIIFVAAGAGGLVTIPQIQLLETAVCREVLDGAEVAGLLDDNGGSLESSCKGKEVQSTVAYIIAVGAALESVIGFLGAIPWSTVADRIGRKPVFVLALAGITVDNLIWLAMIWLQLNFHIPSWTVWFASAGLVMGGGNAMLTSVVLSTITDAAPEEIRATLFMRVHAAALSASLLAPSLASALMGAFGPWVPMLLGVSLLSLSAGAASFVPASKRHAEHDHARLADVYSGTTSTSSSSSGNDRIPSLNDALAQAIKALRAFLPFVGRPSLICLLATVLLSYSLIPATTQLLVQYVSVRYAVGIYDTGYVQTVYGVAQLAQLFLVLPLLARLVRARAGSDAQRDLYLARFSFLVAIPGALLLGAAADLAFFIVGLLVLALGAGCSSYQRSLLSSFFDAEYHSRLFSLVAMVDMVGSVYSGPMLAALFTSGMELGGGGFLGLPYYALACLMAICLALMFFVRLPQVTYSSVDSP